jgi:hypothetical protein
MEPMAPMAVQVRMPALVPLPLSAPMPLLGLSESKSWSLARMLLSVTLRVLVAVKVGATRSRRHAR